MRTIKSIHIIFIPGLILTSILTRNSEYIYLLIIYMLFTPLLDTDWFKQHFSGIFRFRRNWKIISMLVLLAITGMYNDQIPLFIFSTVIISAFPEEWFFRGYLQTKFGNRHSGIIISSLTFSLIHAITISWTTGILVFLPSIFFGYLFMISKDIIFVTLVHTFSNVLFKIYFEDIVLLYFNAY